MAECPTCGRTDFKSEEGMKQHHARTHGKSLSMVDLECEWCGKSYQLRTSKAENSRFCSNECKFNSLHEQKRKENPASNELSCETCGETIYRHDYEIESADNFYCSRECKNRGETGENHHRWSGGDISRECAICGKEVKRALNHLDNYDHAFCSDNCQYEWMEQNYSGSDHPSWKGGVKHGYPGNWKKIRQEVRERDNYECRACGISQNEHLELRGFKLDVHHVVPVREFDDPVDAHSKGNLVTACRSCHRKYEGLPVFPL